MFKAKALKGLLFAVIVFLLVPGVYARQASEEQINIAFDEVVYEKLLMEKSYAELTPKEIDKLIVPSAAEFFKATIDRVRKQYKADISADDIWNALAPNVEEVLMDMKDEIDEKVEKLLEPKK